MAGPHSMTWTTGGSFRAGLVAEYVDTTSAVLGGRAGWDGIVDDARPYGGAWDGPYDAPGAEPIRLWVLGAEDPTAAVNVRCYPMARSPRSDAG